MGWHKYVPTKVHYCSVHVNKYRRKIYSPAICGTTPMRKGTDKKKYVTCKKCLKILAKNGNKEKEKETHIA